jgi:hypothetical protein
MASPNGLCRRQNSRFRAANGPLLFSCSALRQGLGAALVLAALAASAAPSAAAARGHSAARGAGRGAPVRSASFTVRGTHGYTLNVRSERGIVTIVSAAQRPPVATISARGGVRAANGGDVTASTYYAFGSSADPRRVDPALGPLGRISVSFKPSGRTHVIRLGTTGAAWRCDGPRRIVRHLGTFVGTIRFHGENGYTRVDRARARGSVGTSPSAEGCATIEPAPGAGPGDPLTAPAALSATDARSGVSFEATTVGATASFEASWSGSLGAGVVVSRTARAVAGLSRFAHDGALGAVVRPPAPFFGSASLDLSPGPVSRAWSGNLGVEFPGQAVHLTGPRFRAALAGEP